MKVLSVFDGISCGQVALNRCGIKVDEYYASEIDKYAIQVAQKNFPNTIQLGPVELVNKERLPKIDILIGGSPCQGFSFAGKQLNFEDPRSKLFFEFVRLKKELKPKYFFLENVKMKKEYQDIISELLGVEPVEVNSNLVSAQNRKRLYWTNIEGFVMPEDKGILLKDVVHENYQGDGLKDNWAEWIAKNGDFQFKKKYSSLSPDKAITMTARQYASWNGNFWLEKLSEYIVPFDKTLQILDKEVEKGKVGYFRKDSQANRVYYVHGKSVTLCGEAGGGAAKIGQYLFGKCTKAMINIENHKSPNGLDCIGGLNKNKQWVDNGKIQQRNFSQGERVYSTEGKSPTISANSGGTAGKGSSLIFGCITPDRINKRQNGQRFNDGKKFYTLTAQDKHGILVEGYIRKLTPVECERLQTLEDGYTEGVSNTQRYKALGNGWTVDVICEFFKNI